MYICEIHCNDIQVLPPTKYKSIKDISKDLELSTNQVYDIYEGRTTKKYNSRMMPKISISKITK